jgi:hypothetical protein
MAIELKLAEGSPLDQADVTRIVTYATTHNLTQDQANALLKDQETTATAAITRRQPVVPEKYELKLSDKSPLDKTDLEKIAAYAKTHKLTQAQAEALVKEQEGAASGVITRQTATVQAAREEWKKQVETDKDLGGAKLPETLKVCKRAMDRFAPADSPMAKMLEETGYGNHPLWVKLMHQIGLAMKEDSKGIGDGGGSGGKKPWGSRLYKSA